MSRISYEDACDAGYDGPTPLQEARARARRRQNDLLDPRDPDYDNRLDDDEQEDDE